ncbi:helix-turn-helix transcriptional regulator [Thermovibrio sp.]
MEKLALVIEILKVLIKKNRPLTTSEIHRELSLEGFFSSDKDRVERRRLLRALDSLSQEGYVLEVRDGREKRWSLSEEKFKFLTSYTRDELISLMILFSFFPSHYKNLSLFKAAFDAISRFEKGISEEERELLKFSFERIPNTNERCVNVNSRFSREIIGAILENRGLYLQYKGKSYKLFPVKFFTYNGLFYVGALTEKGYRNFLLSRIEYVQPLNDKISLEEKKKKVKETFEIPDEFPFLFSILFPHSYATDLEIERGIKFFSHQFHIERKKEGIVVYTVGFTGKRYASWLLSEKVLRLNKPTKEVIGLAKKLELKTEIPKLTYSLSENLRRFNSFLKKSRDILRQRVAVYGIDF